MAIAQPLFVTLNGPSGTDSGAPAMPGATMTGTAVVYSAIISGKDRQNISGQLQWTGTPTGTFVLQYSDKQIPDQTNDNDWTNDAATFTQPAGSAGSSPIGTAATQQALSALHRRIKYTNASGVGVLNGNAYAPQMR